MATSSDKCQILPEPLHTQILKLSIANLNNELQGNSRDDPEYEVDGKWNSIHHKLYCLHIEHYAHLPNDFNMGYLCGWKYGDMIITFAKQEGCRLYTAWKYLMETYFDVVKAKNRFAVDSAKVQIVDHTMDD